MVRNRELMRVFHDLDLVEQLGSGMKRIMEVYDENIFEFTEHFMFVTFPFAEGFSENNTKNNTKKDFALNEKEQKVLDFMANDKNATAEKIAELLKSTTRTAQNYLKSLQNKGAIKRQGSKKTGYWEIL